MDNENEEIKVPEKNSPQIEQELGAGVEKEQTIEGYNPVNERAIADELRREIELMDIEDNLKDEAKKKAEKIDSLDEKEKIEHLLQIAREKGLIFAINVCKKMNDPYLLDVLHDLLAKEGFYRQFMKKKDDDNDDN